MPTISLNSWLYASFPPAYTPCYTLEETIDRLDAVGFDAIEIGAASPHAWPPYMVGERLEQVQTSLDRSDLTVSSICPLIGGGPGINPASPIDAERETATDHYFDCIDLAATLDADVIPWLGGWRHPNQSNADAWNNMQTVFEQVVERAEDKGRILAIEAIPGVSVGYNVINTPQDQLDLLRAVESDSVGVMFDTYHSTVLGESPSDYVDELGEHLVHLHLADTDRLPPGEGELSFSPMLERLDDIGYDGAYAIEIYGRHLTPDEAALTARRNVQRLLE